MVSQWIAYFPTIPIRPSEASPAKLWKRRYSFRNELPDNVTDVLADFLADSDPAIQRLAGTLTKELADE